VGLGGKTGQKLILVTCYYFHTPPGNGRLHPPITYHHLVPWLQGNLVLVDLTFNFDDKNNKFETNLDTMLQDFEDGLFKRVSCFHFYFSNTEYLIRTGLSDFFENLGPVHPKKGKKPDRTGPLNTREGSLVN
jgi:hypothetical protein